MRGFKLVVLVVLGVLTLGSIAPAYAPIVATSPVSDSMEPTIETHEVVLIWSGIGPITPSVEPGDVIMFTPDTDTSGVTDATPSTGAGEARGPDRPVLHRVDAVTRTGAYTAGDANTYRDQNPAGPTDTAFAPVTSDDIYGVAITHGHMPTTEFPAFDTSARTPEVAEESIRTTSDNTTGAASKTRANTVPDPVTIPYLGLVLGNPIGLLSIWIGVSVTLFQSQAFQALDRTRDYQHRRTITTAKPPRWLTTAVLVILIFGLPGLMTATPVTETVTMVTTEVGPDGDAVNSSRSVQVGDSTNYDVTLSSRSLYGMQQTVHLNDETELTLVNVSASPVTDKTTFTVRNPPRNTPAAFTATAHVYTYPGVLPQPWLQALAAMHPYLAGVVSMAVLTGFLTVPALVFGSSASLSRRSLTEIKQYRNRRRR